MITQNQKGHKEKERTPRKTILRSNSFFKGNLVSIVLKKVIFLCNYLVTTQLFYFLLVIEIFFGSVNSNKLCKYEGVAQKLFIQIYFSYKKTS